MRSVEMVLYFVDRTNRQMLAHPNSMSEVYWARRLLRELKALNINVLFVPYGIFMTIRVVCQCMSEQIKMARAALGWSIDQLC